MNSKNDWIRDYLGVTAWHKAGYTGKNGLTLSGEDFIGNPTRHPIKTLQSFHEIAPDREVKYCNLKDVEGIISLNADCMYVSLEAKGNNSYWRESIDSDLNEIPTIFVSAGNHGNEYKNSYMVPKNVYGASAVRVSPSEMRNGVPVPNATYSVIATNYSAKSEYVDFAGVTDLYLDDGYKFGGTSCACPVLVGMVALVNDFFIQKTGKPLSREKMYQFLQDCSIPETGDKPGIKTERIGWGLPILPRPETIEIERYMSMYKYKDDNNINPAHKADVYRARELGLMSGYNDLFDPTAPLTRQQAASIIVRLYDRLNQNK